nr:hypothetical protein [Sporolactobacillus laevolacticus]
MASGIKSRYGNIHFYCYTARPEHIIRLRIENFKAYNADKAVIAGIEEVARLFKRKKLFIVKERVQRFKKETYMYVWNETTGEQVKLWDDVLDAIRYAIYTNNRPMRRRTGRREPDESVY